MRLLLRRVKVRGKGTTVFQDTVLEGAALRIGRGTDQDVLLPGLRVALHHATLSQGADDLVRLQSAVPSGFLHNGVVVQSAELARGDRLQVGGVALAVERFGPEHDLALVLEEGGGARAVGLEQALLARSCTSLRKAGLRQRPWAWGLFLGLLTAFLVLPAGGFLAKPAREALRELPLLPSDHAWISGPSSAAHRAVTADCNGCHQRPFRMTGNEACLECHAATAHHVSAQVLEGGAFDDSRCGSCHHEHTGESGVVQSDHRLCSHCHADLRELHAETTLEDVTDFGRDHPQFKASMVRWEAGDTPRIERVSLDERSKLKETSNLSFSHKAHFKEGGLRSAAGAAVKLTCADCHQSEPGGGLMQPVSFERHCADCHRLVIPGDVAREMPHGDLQAALGAVEDYFAGWALRGGYPNLLAPEVVQRQRPGREPTADERQEALAWARESAALATAEMLQFTTCATCHQASRTESGWRMAPVQVAQHWFPKARFSHASHDTMECEDCHKGAAKSDQETDVLMQGAGIEACRECHGGAGAPEGRVASTCIDCHGFHVARETRFVAAKGPAGGAADQPEEREP